jgi:hypothetical protein
MSTNLIQFGSIFAARGVTLKYNSELAELEVVESYPDIVEQALKDIALFDYTANYVDGAAALCIATFVDDVVNPLSPTIRDNVLHALGIKKNDRWVYQALSLQKNNRAWHFSQTASDCSHFGEVCTHRGVNPDPLRKGRTSSRQPNEYHLLNGKGEITREQLVTPALAAVFNTISDSDVISGSAYMNKGFDFKNLKNMSIEDKLKAISAIQESM